MITLLLVLLGFTPFPDIDSHTDCWILVGDTSIVYCGDGYWTTS